MLFRSYRFNRHYIFSFIISRGAIFRLCISCNNNLNARLIRDGNVLYTGSIGSIFREKNAAKQVAAGLECGITLKDFADFKEKDVIEVYKIIETERRI